MNDVAAGRQDTWFSHELTVSNGGGPVRQAVEIKDGGGTPVSSGHVAVPRSSVSPAYDVAGNLANDDRWVYEWDSENRLRKMTPTSASISAGFPNRVVEFVYDWQGRRMAKKVTEGGTIIHKRYLYEGWNVVAEWTLHGSATTLDVPQTYLWGLDLAGQMTGNVDQLQGAGGVGGLLAVDVRKESDASALGRLYASYDGNGNILGWSAADGTVKRLQDYDAFGNVVLKHTDDGGPLASGQGEVTYGFSTKSEEKESGLLYYGYRYYDSVTGRWPSRDPIEEMGGVNLYGFVINRPVSLFDLLGNKPGGSFGTFIAAFRDAEKYLRKEGEASIARGWKQFKKATGGDSVTVWDEPYDWKKRLKETTDADFVMFEKGAINGKASYDAIVGKEVVAAVYCYDAEDGRKYSYNYYSGSMITKQEYIKIPSLGRVSAEDADKLLNQEKHEKFNIRPPIRHFLHTHLLLGIRMPSHEGVRANQIHFNIGLSGMDGDLGYAASRKILIYAIERDGKTYAGGG